MEIEVVQWACIKISTACYDNFTRNSVRSEKKRSTKEGLGEKHLINDWPGSKFSHALRLSENDYRISAKVGESRNKWLLETTEHWVQIYSNQKEINSSQLPILEPVLKPKLHNLLQFSSP